MRTVAQAVGDCRVNLSIFPMVRYTGHADLLLLKFNRWVLSDAMMTGAMVAPAGRSF